MSKVFYRKKFSDYLGEQRAIDDIVQFYQPDGGVTPTPTPVPVTPTPTPSITPTTTITPTPSITPSITPTTTNTPTTTQTPTNTPTTTQTPTNTSTPTNTPTTTQTPTLTPTKTPTPTPTPTTNPICPSAVDVTRLFAIYTNLLPGTNTYNRLSIYTGGTFDSGYILTTGYTTANFIEGVAPNAISYVGYGTSSGSTYYQYMRVFLDGYGDTGWTWITSTGDYIPNGGTFVDMGPIGMFSDPGYTGYTISGGYAFPPPGLVKVGVINAYYLSYPIACPTPTPTASSTQTPTPTNTGSPTPTPTITPTATLPETFHIQAENGDNILTEDSDFIDIQN